MEQPPQGPKPPDWGDMKNKLVAAKGPDRLILIAGVLFLVDSFLPWYGADFGPFSVNIKGWSAGGLAVISILFAIAATLFAASQVVGQNIGGLGQSAGTIYLVTGGGAFVFALLRFVTETSLTKFGLYIAIVLGAILAFGGYKKGQTLKG